MTSPDTGRSAELQVLVDALERIADEQKVYLGHGSYNIEPAFTADEAQTIARAALTDLQSRRAGVAAQPLTFLEKINALEEAHEKGPRIYVQGWQDACQTIREALYPAFGSEHGIVREVASGQEVLGEAAQKEGGVPSGRGAPSDEQRRDIVWLIERNVTPPQYTTERSSLPGLSDDPWRAWRYATAREAQDSQMLLHNDLRDNSRVVEHVFIYAPVIRQNATGGEPRGEAWQSRAEIIEECAKVAEKFGNALGTPEPFDIARAIRSLPACERK